MPEPPDGVYKTIGGKKVLMLKKPPPPKEAKPAVKASTVPAADATASKTSPPPPTLPQPATPRPKSMPNAKEASLNGQSTTAGTKGPPASAGVFKMIGGKKVLMLKQPPPPKGDLPTGSRAVTSATDVRSTSVAASTGAQPQPSVEPAGATPSAKEPFAPLESAPPATPAPPASTPSRAARQAWLSLGASATKEQMSVVHTSDDDFSADEKGGGFGGRRSHRLSDREKAEKSRRAAELIARHPTSLGLYVGELRSQIARLSRENEGLRRNVFDGKNGPSERSQGGNRIAMAKERDREQEMLHALRRECARLLRINTRLRLAHTAHTLNPGSAPSSETSLKGQDIGYGGLFVTSDSLRKDGGASVPHNDAFRSMCKCSLALGALSEILEDAVPDHASRVWAFRVEKLTQQRDDLFAQLLALSSWATEIRAICETDPHLRTKLFSLSSAGSLELRIQNPFEPQADKIAMARKIALLENTNIQLMKQLGDERAFSRSWQNEIRALAVLTARSLDTLSNTEVGGASRTFRPDGAKTEASRFYASSVTECGFLAALKNLSFADARGLNPADLDGENAGLGTSDDRRSRRYAMQDQKRIEFYIQRIAQLERQLSRRPFAPADQDQNIPPKDQGQSNFSLDDAINAAALSSNADVQQYLFALEAHRHKVQPLTVGDSSRDGKLSTAERSAWDGGQPHSDAIAVDHVREQPREEVRERGISLAQSPDHRDRQAEELIQKITELLDAADCPPGLVEVHPGVLPAPPSHETLDLHNFSAIPSSRPTSPLPAKADVDGAQTRTAAESTREQSPVRAEQPKALKKTSANVIETKKKGLPGSPSPVVDAKPISKLPASAPPALSQSVKLNPNISANRTSSSPQAPAHTKAQTRSENSIPSTSGQKGELESKPRQSHSTDVGAPARSLALHKPSERIEPAKQSPSPKQSSSVSLEAKSKPVSAPANGRLPMVRKETIGASTEELVERLLANLRAQKVSPESWFSSHLSGDSGAATTVPFDRFFKSVRAFKAPSKTESFSIRDSKHLYAELAFPSPKALSLENFLANIKRLTSPASPSVSESIVDAPASAAPPSAQKPPSTSRVPFDFSEDDELFLKEHLSGQRVLRTDRRSSVFGSLAAATATVLPTLADAPKFWRDSELRAFLQQRTEDKDPEASSAANRALINVDAACAAIALDPLAPNAASATKNNIGLPTLAPGVTLTYMEDPIEKVYLIVDGLAGVVVNGSLSETARPGQSFPTPPKICSLLGASAEARARADEEFVSMTDLTCLIIPWQIFINESPTTKPSAAATATASATAKGAAKGVAKGEAKGAAKGPPKTPSKASSVTLPASPPSPSPLPLPLTVALASQLPASSPGGAANLSSPQPSPSGSLMATVLESDKGVELDGVRLELPQSPAYYDKGVETRSKTLTTDPELVVHMKEAHINFRNEIALIESLMHKSPEFKFVNQNLISLLISRAAREIWDKNAEIPRGPKDIVILVEGEIASEGPGKSGYAAPEIIPRSDTDFSTVEGRLRVKGGDCKVWRLKLKSDLERLLEERRERLSGLDSLVTQIPILQDLAPSDKRDALAQVTIHDSKRGFPIQRQGLPCVGLILLLSGIILLQQKDQSSSQKDQGKSHNKHLLCFLYPPFWINAERPSSATPTHTDAIFSSTSTVSSQTLGTASATYYAFSPTIKYAVFSFNKKAPLFPLRAAFDRHARAALLVAFEGDTEKRERFLAWQELEGQRAAAEEREAAEELALTHEPDLTRRPSASIIHKNVGQSLFSRRVSFVTRQSQSAPPSSDED